MKNSNTRKTRIEISDFLDSVNLDLREFIRTLFEEGKRQNTKWSSLFDLQGRRRCWEVLQCNESGCPAREKKDPRCWLTEGTLCAGQSREDLAESNESCVKCEVYREFQESPIRSLYENISTLINQMNNEVQKFHRKAITDALTGLLNRTSFDEIVQREVMRSKRLDQPLSLVLFDLDDLKRINDEAGHLAGDYYLREFAALLRRITRGFDFIFRLGGDEFVVLLANGSEADIQHYRSRVQKTLDHWNDGRTHPYAYRLSASSGGACLGNHEFDVEKCLRAADRRMYREKKAHKTGKYCSAET